MPVAPKYRMKLCGQCGLVKPVSEFWATGRNGGPHFCCKECGRKRNQRDRERRKQSHTPPAPEKYCPGCKTIKPGINFYRAPLAPDGLHALCRLCEHRQRYGPELAEEGFKRCGRCREIKPVGEFHKNSRQVDGINNHCRQCSKELQPNRYLRHKYGISASEYTELLIKQGGLCAICRKPETTIHLGKHLRLSVDHNHQTGDVRGLLCYRCNHLVGYLERSEGPILDTAIAYLRLHQSA